MSHFSADEIVLENEKLKIKNKTIKDKKKVKTPKVIKHYQLSEDYRNFIIKKVTNIDKLTDPTTGFVFKQTIFDGHDIMYFIREYMEKNLVVTTEEIKEKYKLKHKFKILKEDSEFYNLFDLNTKKIFQFGLDIGYIFNKLKELNHIVEVIEDY